MRILRSIVLGIGIAILSTSVVLGNFSLAMLEGTLAGNSPTMIEPSQTSIPATPKPIKIVITITSAPPTTTATLPPTPEACPPPSGWIPVSVKQNENLVVLSNIYNSSIDQLIQGNCLKSTDLTVGSILYVPPLPTPTLIPCGPPKGWIIYVVKPKDNLYQISILYQTSVPRLQVANCMGSSTLIITGQSLYVPNVATITPTMSLTPTQTKTATPSPTFTNTPSATSTTIPSVPPTETDTPDPGG